MNNLLVIDTHCDVIAKITGTHDELYSNNHHFDLQRLKRYDGFIQFFAVFVAPSYCPDNAYRRAIEIIDKYEAELAKNHEHIMPVKEYRHIINAINTNKTAAVLSIENGAALEGDIKNLDKFYDLGVRSICLTWNGSNQIGCGVRGDNLEGGLTNFGFDVVKRMNELKMLVDVSHINEASFWDVINTSTAPIIASHSNAKAQCDHLRNLTDCQFKALIKNNGVTGINLCPPFLNESGTADLNDILRHIEHFMSLGGENNIGMGADLDGISSTPQGIDGVQHLGNIFEELLRANYTEEQVRKIAGLNFMRVMEQVF